MFVGYLFIVLKFISSSSASVRHTSELKNEKIRIRRDSTYQNSLGNHLSTHHTTKFHRNSSYGSKTGFSMANFQAIRAQEEFAARIAMKQAAKARRKAQQEAMLTRISQLKRECICRLYCRGPRSACEELMELEDQIQK